MNHEAVLEGAAEAVHVTEVVDAGPLRVDAGAERLDDRLAQALGLCGAERSSGATRVDSRTEQRLVGVDVADAGHPALVEQQRLDGRSPPAHHRAQVGGREVLVEGLATEPGREKHLEGLGAEQQLPCAEAPGVGDRKAHPASTLAALGGAGARPELDAHTGVGRLGVGVGKDGTGHAQVLGQVHVALEVPEQVLATAAQAKNPPACQRVGQLVRCERPRPARVEYLHAADAPALDERRQLAADRLDLGQLGHRPSL